MGKLDAFLSCDWGTTSFRLRLVEVATFCILGEVKSGEGISSTFNLWKDSGEKGEEERMHFYLKTVNNNIKKLQLNLDTSLDGLPVIFSGMASSSVGMRELPYGDLPFGQDGSGIPYRYFENILGFNHPLLLISGIKSEKDVMRGEETQLLGGLLHESKVLEEWLVIFPGTHCKHVRVNNGMAKHFTTYMTGEFFDLLSKSSILKTNIEENSDNHVEKGNYSFRDGLKEGLENSLLSAAFRVRTNDLFGKYSKRENYNYLSGLLIGSELSGIDFSEFSKIYLICNSNLKNLYQLALTELGNSSKLRILPDDWESQAVIRGQFQIYNQIKK